MSMRCAAQCSILRRCGTDREGIGPRASDGPAMLRNYGETTQCAAVDARGGVATLIHSLYRPFGAEYFAEHRPDRE